MAAIAAPDPHDFQPQQPPTLVVLLLGHGENVAVSLSSDLQPANALAVHRPEVRDPRVHVATALVDALKLYLGLVQLLAEPFDFVIHPFHAGFQTLSP